VNNNTEKWVINCKV